MKLKTDSFPVQANVHFPTDYGLLYDSTRKTGDVIEKLIKQDNINGFRKIKDWINRVKNLQRKFAKTSISGGKNKKKKEKKLAKDLLTVARAYSKKLNDFMNSAPSIEELSKVFLKEYIRLLDKHIDLFYRRLILEEKIPHQEKMFSIFEQYTEWLSKGKRNVEIGKNTSITTDQYGLIIDFHVMNKETDSQIVISTMGRILPKYRISSWSFDKGYWSQENYKALIHYVPHVIMPKKGRPNKEEKQRENSPQFKNLRKKHSAIESNINELEHSGLHRCRDKGYEGFKRYVAMGVIAHNLKRIGRELLRQEIAAKKLSA